ncbi:2-oxo-4-hydroxy-4-carboxy-5-ureidoimidazoline decarboxylase [Dickeya zeae]|uniref:2-oxo-4-hydroxy-4-carboxy-5-ureidoimidazoline decarboxylase n=1 Tax=Dickeya zeae TaxID=204042 RepID=A0AAE6Z1U6_9GAMM|nr:2-oxo-4-hydroxy-4-carboxy-5-ureidoimidazoline decarboxylase [Dickeya zeae]MCO7262779.1 2-oxo-4-hydroxy-4-carboxy-5-ureidoimidazoline decarboxylase [Dickeya zeae]QIZ52559.1 2-oxo-4-hydroxy-4-carboxy-5-ureidoimidazoline decarboxylase [Dickeya zeae]QYM92439.1 2-oxo-4-hydroxy-4-carboxy-5-ureidoimidazoline decarboxylase [Dickeya zeae]
MITLEQFNLLSVSEAVTLITPCVALPGWAKQVVAGRPYGNRAALLATGLQATQGWQEEELAQALRTHPRIGEPVMSVAGISTSGREPMMAHSNENTLANALRAGNARYESRFGRVFLIHAKGRSGEEILRILHRRLQNDDRQEAAEALEQLRQITLLRLESMISE